MKIHIYACSFGAGHMNAARYIKEQLEGNEVYIYDVVDGVFPVVASAIYKTYKDLIFKQNFLYKLYLKIEKKKENFLPKLEALEKKVFQWLDNQEKPDVYIASYSVIAYFLSRYIEERNLDIPLITCITDFSPHELWINPKTSLYLVASNFTAEQLKEKGIASNKIVIFGLGKAQSLKKDDLKDYPSHILVTGGGLGILPKKMAFYRQLRAKFPGEIRIICGKNKSLRRRLERLNLPQVDVYGFVNNMSDQLKWADVYIGKSGGLSTFEAICSQTPILYLPPFLPQEIKNAKFIFESQIGSPIWESHCVDDYINYKNNMEKMQKEFKPEQLEEWLYEESNVK